MELYHQPNTTRKALVILLQSLMTQPGSRKKRILIVDDHPSMRMGLAHLINNEPDLEVEGEVGTMPIRLTQAGDLS
jgi:PleD family two-component response regulator